MCGGLFIYKGYGTCKTLGLVLNETNTIHDLISQKKMLNCFNGFIDFERILK
jgi:hypothetical protein